MPPLPHHALLSAKLHSLNLPTTWCTYILVCQDGSYYVGATENLPARILAHAEGKGGGHTKENRPVIFAW
jgi:predicted GIY-YIG superfamily endonuclease